MGRLIRYREVKLGRPVFETDDWLAAHPRPEKNVVRTFRSRYAGICLVCHRQYQKGTLVTWVLNVGTFHPDCLRPSSRAKERRASGRKRRRYR